MLVEPRPPARAHAVADLQHRLHARAEAAAYQAEMATMLARHQFEDGARLPVPLDPDHDAFIGPLHADCIRPESGKITAADGLFLRKLQPHGPIALRVVAPALAHLDEQEQVHLVLDDLGDFPPRRFADRLESLPAFADHDLALALAF